MEDDLHRVLALVSGRFVQLQTCLKTARAPRNLVRGGTNRLWGWRVKESAATKQKPLGFLDSIGAGWPSSGLIVSATGNRLRA